MLIGICIENDEVFNGAQLALCCSLFVEVSANIYLEHRNNEKLIRTVHELHRGLNVNTINPAVVDFAQRIEKGRYINPIWCLTVFSVGVIVPVLFVVYASSIPFEVVFWAYVVMTWPLLGVFPIILLRTKLGVQLQRTQVGGGSSFLRRMTMKDDQVVAIAGSSSVQSPQSIALRKVTIPGETRPTFVRDSNPEHLIV